MIATVVLKPLAFHLEEEALIFVDVLTACLADNQIGKIILKLGVVRRGLVASSSLPRLAVFCGVSLLSAIQAASTGCVQSLSLYQPTNLNPALAVGVEPSGVPSITLTVLS